MRIALAAGCALIVLTSAAAAQLRQREFDAYAKRGLELLHAPGAAIAVVKDGKVLFAKGYGVRTWGAPARVDAHTLFQIASNTKAFTTAALAILADDGRLSWDDPVTKFLPGFQLYDPYVTHEFTVRDLVTHRSGLGLGAGDLLWLHSSYSREQIAYRIRYAKPASSFRSQYAYDNVLYDVAGEVVRAVSSKTWDDFVKERIFSPLGMTESGTTIADWAANPNVATPHDADRGRIRIVPLDTADNLGPGASIVSNVTDLAKWLLCRLDSGRAGGGRLFSERQAREMWSGQTILPITDPEPPLAPLRPNFAEYGLGWRLRDYQGRKVVWHGGELAGMTSEVTLVPAERLGIVILTNSESDLAPALTARLLDSFFKVRPTDWVAAYVQADQLESAHADSIIAAARATRDSLSKPSLGLERYAGSYRDELYGDATIALEGDHLVLRFSHSPAFTGDLEHWQYDTFVAHWRTPHLEEAYVTFGLKPDGSIERFRMAAVSPLADFSYDYQDLEFRPVSASSRSGR
ncbi:MAG TPA: serine hydrolase [Gemmatimonadales bacterium]|nr:serine hydrolase [Gemmatimonadales bacterium]